MEYPEVPIPLLPPSCFEVPKGTESLKSIAELTKEMLRLKDENIQLRDQCSTLTATQKQVPLPINSLMVTHHETKHMHDLIDRQATEINELKRKIVELEAAARNETASLQNRMEANQLQHTKKLAALEEQLEEQAKKHAKDISRKDAELAESKRHLTEQLTSAQQTITELKNQVTETVGRSQAELASRAAAQLKAHVEQEEIRHKLESALQDKEGRVKELESTVARLKGLLVDSQENEKSSESWKREVSTLRTKLESTEKEKTHHEKSAELLNLRLAALAEVIQSHENEIAKVSEVSVDKKRAVVVTRWREKVYELLVQLKLADIVQKDTESRAKVKICDLQDELRSSKGKTELLQHSLDDRQAALKLQQQEIVHLRNELNLRAQEAQLASSQAERNLKSLRQLQSSAELCSGNMGKLSGRLSEALSVLHVYGQRVSFISNRVEVVQGQVIRLKTHTKLQQQKEPTDTSAESTRQAQWSHLTAEVERLTNERNTLSAQLAADAQLLETRIAEAQDKYAAETELLRRRCVELHEQLETNEQERDLLQQQLIEREHLLSESSRNVEQLKQILSQQQLDVTKIIDDMKREHDLELANRLAEAEQRLNDSRREQTKSAVALQQAERQLAREHEQREEQSTAIELEWRRKTDKLLQQLKTVEADKNLLMSTLRQEGLLDKVKAARKGPAIMSVRNDDSLPFPTGALLTPAALTDTAAALTDTARGSSSSRSLLTDLPLLPSTIPANAVTSPRSEPLEDVVRNLQLLAATVLDDNDDDSSHNVP